MEGRHSGSILRPALSPGWLGPRAPCPPALPRHRPDHGPHPCASPVHWPQPAPEAQVRRPSCLELRTLSHQPPGAPGTWDCCLKPVLTAIFLLSAPHWGLWTPWSTCPSYFSGISDPVVREGSQPALGSRTSGDLKALGIEEGERPPCPLPSPLPLCLAESPQ